jgi:hypothetical protein
VVDLKVLLAVHHSLWHSELGTLGNVIKGHSLRGLPKQTVASAKPCVPAYVIFDPFALLPIWVMLV